MVAIVVAVAAATLLPPPLHLVAVIIALIATVALIVGLVPVQAPVSTPTDAPEVGSHMQGPAGLPVVSTAAATTASAAPVAGGTTSRPAIADPDLTEVLAALPVGVMVIGDDGKIRSFNAAAGELFGVPDDRAQNRALIEIVRNFELDRRVTATLRAGTEETGELAYFAAHERFLQVTTRVLAGANGRRSALVIVADQTRMRELEKLRQDFVSNVSHELRTPLTAVKLMVETLQSGVERPASDEFLGSIAQETERMIALVEDLLDLARLESGKLDLRLSAVDVTELCRDAGQAQARRAQTLGVTLSYAAPELPMKISADRDKLYQVVVNLLDNALRHTPSGGRVDLAVEPAEGTVDIVVSDTGSGIPSSALPHIFERFYVVDPARARGHSGTGLGLSIVKHIIEAHGGTVEATSELGAGSTFRCRLVARS
jgi:two-component system phosphate regulon sensor histidine kinase PhoR